MLVHFIISGFTLFTTSPSSQVDALHRQAYTLLDSNPDSACALAQKALVIASEADYEWGVGNSYYIQGFAFEEKDNQSKALLNYLRGIEILKELGDSRSVKAHLGMLLNSGGILRNHYRYEDARAFYQRGLERIGTDQAYTTLRLKFLMNMANVLSDEGNLDSAYRVLREAIRIADFDNNLSMLTRCYNLIGTVADNNLQYPLAREYYKKVISAGFEKETAMALHNTGVSFDMEGKLDSAALYYQKALRAKQIIDHKVFTTARDLTELYLKAGRIEQSTYYGLMAVSRYDGMPLHPDNYDIFRLLDLSYRRKNRNDSAQMFASRYYVENDRFHARQKDILKLKEQFKVELLLNVFYAEVKTDKVHHHYRWIIGLILGTVVIYALRRLYLRWTLARELLKITRATGME